MKTESGATTYRLIAFDMDGTLLDSNKRILPSSVAAIKKAQELGKIVCLSTGRCLPELRDFLAENPYIRYVIGDSGAYIYDSINRQFLDTTLIPVETAVEIMNRLEGIDAMIHLHTESSIVQRSHVMEMDKYGMGVYQGMFLKICNMREDIRKEYLASPFPLFKFNTYCKSREDRNEVRRRVSDLNLEMADAEAGSFEMSPGGVTKGSGLSKLCSLLDIPLSETIAVGDADNDLPVLETAGMGIAMGNSNRHILNIAAAIVQDNDSGGCAEAIEKYLLG